MLRPLMSGGAEAVLVVAEGLVGAWADGRLGAALGAYLGRGGRVLLLQQGEAGDFEPGAQGKPSGEGQGVSWMHPALQPARTAQQ